jgi:hypothetical protein
LPTSKSLSNFKIMFIDHILIRYYHPLNLFHIDCAIRMKKIVGNSQYFRIL